MAKIMGSVDKRDKDDIEEFSSDEENVFKRTVSGGKTKSLIDDDDKLNLENFTVKEPYLRRECKTHLEPSSILSAKKTFR